MNNNAIIIVEDDEEDCNFLKTAIKENGFQHQFICFNNAVEALLYLRSTSNETSLIISDINMPYMNGISFKNAIDKDPHLHSQKIPFVFLSSIVDNIDTIVKLSATACIKKPHNISGYDLIAKTIDEISQGTFKA